MRLGIHVLLGDEMKKLSLQTFCLSVCLSRVKMMVRAFFCVCVIILLTTLIERSPFLRFLRVFYAPRSSGSKLPFH